MSSPKLVKKSDFLGNPFRPFLGPKTAPRAPGPQKSDSSSLSLHLGKIWARFDPFSAISGPIFGFHPPGTSAQNAPKQAPRSPLEGSPGCPRHPSSLEKFRWTDDQKLKNDNFS